MLTIQQDRTILLDTGYSGEVWATAFYSDGKHILGGNGGGIRQWRLTDGQEVGKQTGMIVQAISVSRDGKWIVCGTNRKGARVWDGEMHKGRKHRGCRRRLFQFDEVRHRDSRQGSEHPEHNDWAATRRPTQTPQFRHWSPILSKW